MGQLLTEELLAELGWQDREGLQGVATGLSSRCGTGNVICIGFGGWIGDVLLLAPEISEFTSIARDNAVCIGSGGWIGDVLLAPDFSEVTSTARYNAAASADTS